MGKYQIGYCSRLTSQGGLGMEAMRKGRSMVFFALTVPINFSCACQCPDGV